MRHHELPTTDDKEYSGSLAHPARPYNAKDVNSGELCETTRRACLQDHPLNNNEDSGDTTIIVQNGGRMFEDLFAAWIWTFPKEGGGRDCLNLTFLKNIFWLILYIF